VFLEAYSPDYISSISGFIKDKPVFLYLVLLLFHFGATLILNLLRGITCKFMWRHIHLYCNCLLNFTYKTLGKSNFKRLVVWGGGLELEIKSIYTNYANSYLLWEEQMGIIIDPASDINVLQGVQIINCLATHGHADHIVKAKSITEKYKIPLTLHQEDVIYVQDDSYNLSKYILGESLSRIDNLQVIKDGDQIDFNGHNLRVLHTPGHTPGSVMYLLDDKYLFSGDTVFKDSIGRTDFPGSNPQQMADTLEKLINIDKDWVVYPGHGEVTTWSEAKKSLKYWRQFVNAR